MSTFLSKEVQDGLEKAQKAARKKSTRLRIRIGDDAYPILTFEEHGFITASDVHIPLRGLVDIYEGPKHLYQALIVASEETPQGMRYEFKRATRPEKKPAVDYVQTRPTIAGLLT